MTLVHGSPRDPLREYVVSTGVALANLAELTTPYGLHGHTHVPIAFIDDGAHLDVLEPADGASLTLDGRPALLNPGSVGQPRDGDPRAAYLVLDTEAGHVTWHRVPYDIGGSRRPSGPPGCRADWRTGWRSAREAGAMIGGRRPLQGRKPGDRRVRVERPHAPYFRYTGKGQLTAKEAASAPTTHDGSGVRLRPRIPVRPAAGERGRARRAPEQDQGAGDLQLRRDQLVRLRDRGDPARPHPRRRGGAGLRDRDQHRHLHPARRRRDLLPPDLRRLSDRRRLVHGLAPEHRTDRQPRRRVRPAHRLRHDRRRLDVVGGGTDRLGVPGPVRRARDHRRRRDRPHRHRQPAWPARGRATSSRPRPTCSSARRCS